MWATAQDVRSGARWMGPRAEDENEATLNSANVYHAAFSAVGSLMAQPVRLLRDKQQKTESLPDRRMKRKVNMTKTVERSQNQWVRIVRDYVVAPVVSWYQRQRMVEELNGLSDRVLADIGLTRAEIPMAVKQAYGQVRRPVFVATESVATTMAVQPAASNDEAKQPLAA